jgi:Zierdtviridae exonuclease
VGNPPIIRTSERKEFRRCPQRWWWGYRCGLRGKGKPADALWFGTGIHVALASWYGEAFHRGPLPAHTFRDWIGNEVREIKANLTDRDRDWFDEPVYIDAGDLGQEMLSEYVRTYGIDRSLEILAVEQPFQVELTEDDEVVAIFAGTFDGVALDHEDGNIYLLEHKTAGSVKTAHLPLDDQAGGYFAAATVVLRHQGIIAPRENISGIMYNFLRKAMPDPRERNKAGAYLNKDGSISKRQPPPPFHREWIDRSPGEVRSQLQRITDEVVIMNGIRNGELPITKNTNDQCTYCPFYTMCLLHERGGNAWKEFRDKEYRIEDPYADHRKSTAE